MGIFLYSYPERTGTSQLMEGSASMVTVTRSHEVVIQAPREKVFNYVSDLTRHPEWSGGELKIEALTPGPVVVGKEYVSRGQVAVQRARPNTVRVSEYDPPRSFTFVARDPDFGRVIHEFTFHEQGEGVLVRRVMTLSMGSLMAFLFRTVLYPLIGRPSMERAMRSLKKKLEA
jgi:uncharacterized protein YndB with AHSA1/START domain